MITIDTNCLIRFFTEDDRQKAEQTRQLLHSSDTIRIPDVVFPELEYILCRQYQVSREDFQESLRFLISLPNLKIGQQVVIAVNTFEQTNLDMADCIIAAYSQSGQLASFDKKLTKVNNNGYWEI